MGVDRDEDGLLDGDVPAPTLHLARSSDGAILNWPLSATGFDLQFSDLLSPPAWSNSPDPIEVLGDQNYVTNSLSTGSRFFRLRAP